MHTEYVNYRCSANAVLSDTLAPQLLQPVAGRNSQIPHVADTIDLVQLPYGSGPKRPWTRLPSRGRVNPVKDILGTAVPEGPYHGHHYGG